MRERVGASADVPIAYDGVPAGSLGYGHGWFPVEYAGGEPFRWTAPEFGLAASAAGSERLVIDYARPDFFSPTDCAISGPDGSITLAVHAGRHRLEVELGSLLRGPGSLNFSLSEIGRAAGDDREFGLCVFGVTLAGEASPSEDEVAADGSVQLGQGWFPAERDGRRPFRWTEPSFDLTISADAECLVFDCARPHFFGAAECVVSGPDGSVRLPVPAGWYKLVVELPPVLRQPGSLHFSLSKVGRAEGDDRELGLVVYGVSLASGDAASRARRDRAIADLPAAVESPPRVLSIAASDQCNLRCVMCGTHHSQDGDNNAGRDHLGPGLIDKIRPLAGSAEFVQLHGGAGEPLFNPEFWRLADAFSDLSDSGAVVEIHTNGLLFTPRNIRRLIESRITHVSLSFDAATEPLYRRIRGGDFARLLSNVRSLVAARARSGGKDLRLSANMTVFQANVHEAPALVTLAHELGLDAVLLMHLNGGDAYDWVETKHDDGWVFDYRANLPEADPQYVMGYIHEARRVAAALGLKLTVDSRFDVYGISVVETPAAQVVEPAETRAAEVPEVPDVPEQALPPLAATATVNRARLRMVLRRLFRRSSAPAGAPPVVGAAPQVPATEADEAAAPPRYSSCREPWTWLNIAANGDVTPCCWAVQPLANLNDVGSLADIWNGEKMVELRTNIRENRVDAHVCAGASCVYVAR